MVCVIEWAGGLSSRPFPIIISIPISHKKVTNFLQTRTNAAFFTIRKLNDLYHPL